MKREKVAAIFLAALTVLSFAASAGAVDGTIEINQAKVNAAGGFPYTISNTGSYRLTGNLTVPASTNGIIVSADNVTIDLNGFSIVGPGGPSTTPSGISALGFAGITVENGSVSGFGAVGIALGTGIVRNVHANTNGSGIQGGANSVIEGCTANQSTSSSGFGISCSPACVISGDTANHNVDGIDCPGNGCVISGNTVSSNSDIGIKCASLCAIFNNTVFFNATGISANDATTGYGVNVLQNTTNFSGGTSLGAKNTNLCAGTAC